MDTEMISMEKIKPGSPTPAHLRTHKISIFDQIMLPIYTPAILYFPPDPDPAFAISQRIQLLKDSLASALTTFYPLAGIIKDFLSVDCNDDGVPVFVSKVKAPLRHFLEHPDLMLLINKALLPTGFDFEQFPGPGSNVTMIQLNCFDCGGMAISVVFAHYVADLTSICSFLRAWAAFARGSSGEITFTPLNCAAQSVFPQKADLPMESSPYSSFIKFLSTGKFITRRYVFEASSISRLKARSTDLGPTRVDVVTALIWKCFMAAVGGQSRNNDQKPFLITHAVNLRRRAGPALPEGSFGNLLWPATALCSSGVGKEMKKLVSDVKRGIRKIDKEFVKRFEAEEGYHENLEEFRKKIPEEATFLSFTSWANIGLYEVDFGWGRPIWLSGIVSNDSSETMFPNNIVTLMDTIMGDGIEAWVILEEKYVAGFEENTEIRKYARLNPSVL